MAPADQSKPRAKPLVLRLIGRSPSEGAPSDSAAIAAAAACDRLYRELSRWVGPDGCHALFTRALAQATVEHPGLRQIQLRPRAEPYVQGVTETIAAKGDGETGEALEAMLIRLVESLGRLVGADIATKLIERGLEASERNKTRSDVRREES